MSAEVLRFPDGRPLFDRPTAAVRVVHQKLGFGTVVEVDSNQLTIDYDGSGRRVVVDSFVRVLAGGA